MRARSRSRSLRGDGRYGKRKKRKKYIYLRMLAERFLKVIEIGKFWLGLDQWFPIRSSTDESVFFFLFFVLTIIIAIGTIILDI